MHKKNLAKVGTTALVAAGLAAGALAVASPAMADIAPTSSDAVAVGSDTVQYVADFLADGDNAGDAGYNGISGKNRIFSFDATGDASGRAAYVNGTSTALASTIILRQQQSPVARPNGSGAGITAIIGDTAHSIDFVRSSRLPTQQEQTNASGVGGLHVYQIATDGLQIAAATTTNAPAAGISAAKLADIYTGSPKTWSQEGLGSSTATIVAVLPQTGSGTRKDFVADLLAKTGVNIEANLVTNIKISEEHDPTAVAGNPNAIAPFSTGRDNLIESGYFNGAPAAGTIKLLPGTAAGQAATDPYFLTRSLYFISRQNDVTSGKKFQPGTAANLVNALFGTANSSLTTPDNASIYQAAGVTQAYADKGLAHS